MTRGIAPDTEAELHWRESVCEIDEAITSAEITELTHPTYAGRRAATRMIQRLNRDRVSLMEHHPLLPQVICICNRSGCTAGPARRIAS